MDPSESSFDFSAPSVPDEIRAAVGRIAPDRLAELLTDPAVLVHLEMSCNPNPSAARMAARGRLASLGLWYAESEPEKPPPPPPDPPSVYNRDGKRVIPREPPPEPKLRMTDIMDIKAQSVRWLWPYRIPCDEVTIFFGRMNDGKSTFLGWLTATVTEGTPWPDCPDDNEPGTVLLFQSEENNATSVRPRVEAFGLFGRGKLLINEGIDRGDGREGSFNAVSHADQLIKYCEDVGNVKLIIFDPIKDFLGDYKSNDDNDVTDVMLTLGRVARTTGAAIVLVMHPRKDQEGDILDCVGGSSAWMRKARAGWYLSVDPGDPSRRLLSLLKDNADDMSQTAIACQYDRKRRTYAWFVDPIEMKARHVHNILRRQERDAVNNAVKPKRGPDPAESKRAEDIILKILETGPMLQSSSQDLALNRKVARSTFHRMLTKLRKTDGRVVRFEQPGDERYWLTLRAEPAESGDNPPAAPADGEQSGDNPPPDPPPES